MSWFSRLREFVEEDDILADDFEAEFDGIATALNSLFQSGSVVASADFGMGGSVGEVWESSYKVTGTEKSVTAAVASILLVTAVFDFRTQETSGGGPEMRGVLVVDGSPQTKAAKLRHQFSVVSSGEVIEGTVSQTYVVELAAGAHTLSLYARPWAGSVTGSPKALKDHTGYTYLLIPDPEP